MSLLDKSGETTRVTNLADAIRQDLHQTPQFSALLEAEGLAYKINGRTLLNEVDFQISTGEVLALVGPNGAGKSTLLKLLSGDLRPTAGDVRLEGFSVGNYTPRQLALKRAVMTQSALLSFDFSAFEVVMMGRYPHGGSALDEQIAAGAMQQTETEHLAERLYPTLSGGEAARVTLSRVLAQQTKLLLLDEPTAALDLRHQQIVMQLSRALAEAGAAVMAIVHDLNLAAAHADRVLILHEGQVYAQGAPQEVLTEANLERVFNLPVRVIPHPESDPDNPRPLVIPLAPLR